jgi:hypothetical protein
MSTFQQLCGLSPKVLLLQMYIKHGEYIRKIKCMQVFMIIFFLIFSWRSLDWIERTMKLVGELFIWMFKRNQARNFFFPPVTLFFAHNVKRPPLWSSGQSSWLQIQRSWVWFPQLPDFLGSRGCGMESAQPREYNSGATWKKKYRLWFRKARIQPWGSVALTTRHPSIYKSWH